ncbi:transposase [Aspergillus fumigatus Z5]|nr:transposase [Aspergillus fumigatus Z5]
MPVTPKLLEEFANQSLQRAGEARQVSRVWAYRFEKRLPEYLNLGPVKQKTKESKRIKAEDAGLLANWYNQLANVVKDTPPRLVYNFDECGFRPGEGKARNVIGLKGSCLDLAESKKATQANGWISDELAHQWLQSFIKATNERTKRGEKRILIFDGHGSHLTVDFLQTCEDNGVIPFGFLPHTTHLCQPLDGKPFLSYKQHFRRINNELSYWAGEPVGKSEFLRVIGPVREKAFNQRIIREAFKDRGIWPVDGSKIVDNLAIQAWEQIPDVYAPDLDACLRGTPSPPPISSSSVDITPPRTIQALKKNQAKLSKHKDLLTPKLQRNLERIFEHNQIAAEHLAIANETINRIRAAQAPLRRQHTKRHVKPLSQDGILKIVSQCVENSFKISKIGDYGEIGDYGVAHPQREAVWILRAVKNNDEHTLVRDAVSQTLTLTALLTVPIYPRVIKLVKASSYR